MPDTPLKTAFLQLPTQILSDLAEGKSPQGLGEAICRFAEGFVPDYLATILVRQPDGRLMPWAGPSVPPALLRALSGLTPGPGAGSCGHAVYHETPTIVTDIAQDVRWNDLREVAVQWQLRSCWSNPVWLAGQVAGTFALTGKAAGSPGPEVLELLEFCAAMVGTVLRYAQWRAQEELQRASLQRALDFNRMLMAVNQAIAEAEQPHTMFQAICDLAVELGGFRLAFIGLPDARGRIRFVASAGAADYLQDLFISIDPALPEGQGSFGRTWREQCVQYNPSFARTPSLAPWRAQAERFGLGSSASLPILRKGLVRAGLSVYHAQEDIFDDTLRSLLEELALTLSRGLDQVFLRRQLEHEQHKLRHLSLHDALTGLPNRSALEQHVPLALARARQDRTLLAVGMVDLDGFKAINDTHGQAAGDYLLKMLAQRLRRALPDPDLVARAGGDEFFLVMENLHRYEDLQPRLDKIARAFQDPLELPGTGTVRLGAALGLTFSPDDPGDGGQLMRHAADALHYLKSAPGPRQSWWQVWGEDTLHSLDRVAPPVPPYGDEAGGLLLRVADALAPLGGMFAQRFRQDWGQHPSIREILERLGPYEQAILLHRLEQHIGLLHAPDLTEARHRELAENMGQRNTLLGLDHTTLVEATQAYHDEVRHCLHVHRGLHRREKQQVLDLIEARLRIELQSQLRALRQLLVERQSWLSRQSMQLAQAGNWVDACRAFLEATAELSGWTGATINRLDATGRLEYEFKTTVLDQYLEALQARGIVPHLQDAATPGLVPAHLRVWQSERIETNVSYVTEAHLEYLRDTALNFGIRSAAFVPITDAQGRMAASLGVFGRHPGQFEPVDMRLFLQSLGHLLSQARQRLYRPQLTTRNADERRRLRQCLEQGGLVLHYQPIVNLQSGRATKVEALARLRLPDDTLVPPGEFLPGFGIREMVLLFRQGLDQALAQLACWLPQYPDLVVSLNLPPAVLLEPDCPRWVEAALQASGLTASQLELEVLENEEFHDLETARDCLSTLATLGVGFVMDDLGAGYSSLVRLRHLPFSTVKIDQGLVREIARDPERVIDFISGLVRLAKSLGLLVVVEGLESPELVEVASLLGADEGQGFALARPMEAPLMAPWLASFQWALSNDHPVTALGQLARQKRGY